MRDEIRTYFRDRAEDELKAGEAATHPSAARAHYLIAGYYFDLAFNPEAAWPPTLPTLRV